MPEKLLQLVTQVNATKRRLERSSAADQVWRLEMPKVEGLGSVKWIVTYKGRDGRAGVATVTFLVPEAGDLRRHFAGREQGAGDALESSDSADASLAGDCLSEKRLFWPPDDLICNASED